MSEAADAAAQAARRRERRERWVPFVAVLLSLLLHLVVLLLLGGQGPAPEPVEPDRSVRLRFLPAPPPEEPAETPPDTPFISEFDAEARGRPEPDEPESPQPSVPEARPTPPRRPEPPPARERPEPTPQEKQPEPRPEPRRQVQPAPRPEPEPTERERVQDAIAGLFDQPITQEMPFERPSTSGSPSNFGAPQFETAADIDWGPYARRIQQIVRSNWHVPTAAVLGQQGAVQTHFYLCRDGRVEELATTVGSGLKILDVKAEGALALSDPFPPPPLPADHEDCVGVTWTFFYNMDNREQRFWYRNREIERRIKAHGG